VNLYRLDGQIYSSERKAVTDFYGIPENTQSFALPYYRVGPGGTWVADCPLVTVEEVAQSLREEGELTDVTVDAPRAKNIYTWDSLDLKPI
jgi:PDZ domain-containing secreted protein